jgi:C1A family cysteine protease
MQPTIADDLRTRLPGVRDQGERATCLSCALSDAHSVTRGTFEPLSSDYLHYHAALRGGRSINGPVAVADARAAMVESGQPSELLCPYSRAKRDEAWCPPVGLAPTWTRSSAASKLAPASAAIESVLAAGLPPILVFRMSTSFYTCAGPSFTVAGGSNETVGSHAVVVVGRGKTAQSDPAFLVRNSWGPAWGSNGHAWLDKSYVDMRALQVVELG